MMKFNTALFRYMKLLWRTVLKFLMGVSSIDKEELKRPRKRGRGLLRDIKLSCILLVFLAFNIFLLYRNLTW